MNVWSSSPMDERRTDDPADRDCAWWLEKLEVLSAEAGGEAFNELSTDYRRPAHPSGKPAEPIIERLDAGTVAALTCLARKEMAGLHAFLLSILAAEATRRDGRRSLIIGSRSGSRSGSGNLIPLVFFGDDPPRFAERIRSAQAALDEAMEHGRSPISLLCRKFCERHPHVRRHSRTSLFDISLTANPIGSSVDPRNGLPVPAGLDLEFSHRPVEGGGLELSLVWNPDVFSRDTARAWLRSFAGWARFLAEDGDRANVRLPALLPEEESRLAAWECGPLRTRPAERCHELFEHLVDRHPYRPAIVAEAGVLSYADLDDRANRVAWELLDRGIVREEPVAVLAECSPDLPVTVLGIWKAGGAYVPLDAEQPADRLVRIANDLGARVLAVLDGRAVPPSLAETVQTILRPEALAGNPAAKGRPRIEGRPQDLAYIIFTSGTTGQPKGVLIQHDSLVNAACSSGELFGLTSEDRFSLVATPGFDASLWELGAALTNGMALAPTPRTVRDDPWALKRYYKANGVTVAFHAPSYLRVSKQTPFDGLRILITGGEAPNHDDARCHAGYLDCWNAYGPTEACIFVCAERLSADPDPTRPLPVGRPLANTRFSIRREQGDRVPPGAKGEVWLSGIGLARGYLNNSPLTAQRFVETPDGRFYRTGDLGRWREDGLLELSGRIDHQVKLHGQRLEPGEIEHALLSHPAVEEAVALMKPAANETQALWAFVRLRPGAAVPAEDEWRDYLVARLPQYMVPAGVIPVAAVPLTPAGKIDRPALLQLVKQRSSVTAGNRPSGQVELRIAAAWKDLLGTDVSREDNFFALGGNSLLAVTMAHRVSLEFERPVAARELFAAPTLAGFAQRVAETLRDAPTIQGAPVPSRTGSGFATEGQREFRVAEAAGLDTRTFTITLLRMVEGGMPSREQWDRAFAVLAARHEALRTYFREDDAGRLLRMAAPTLVPTIETAVRPDRASARALVRERQSEPFVMETPPLWRAGLVESADDGETLFWLAMHHSVGDGRSVGVIMEELSALLSGEDLPPLTCDFAASAAREERYLEGPACADDARYWADLLSRQPATAYEENPLDYPRSARADEMCKGLLEQDTRTGTHRFETRLDAAATQVLKTLARRHEASLHAVLLTLLAVEAGRRAARSEIIIGTAASVRETAAEAQVVGCYVNMLPVPCRVPPQSSFGAVLRETQRTLAAGLQHERYPFARICHDFWKDHPHHRHPLRYPLFDLAVTEDPETQRSLASSASSASLRFRRRPPAMEVSGFDYERTDASPGQDMVLIHEVLADGGLLLQWNVNASLYARETAARWLEGLIGWAAWLGEDRRRARDPLPLLLPSESGLLQSWEQGAKAVRPPVRFHELFERVLDTDAGQRQRPAVVTQSVVTTYESLERDANVIAHRLLQLGVARGAIVGVLTGRSAALPAAVLGVWKAGATYLPLAADMPEQRLAGMARDASIAVLCVLDQLPAPPALGRDLMAAKIPLLRPEEIDADFRRTHTHRPSLPGDVGDAAYVLYTSGSTGRPKGVIVSHEAYINALLGAGEIIGLTREDRCLMSSSPSFDVSLSDIGLPLAHGAALCPVSFEVLSSPNSFMDFLEALEITAADIPPSYLRLFNGAAFPSRLRILVTGGEAPYPADIQVYAGRHRYFNAYGPTENAITSSMRLLAPGQAGKSSVGRPLPNTSIHVCDPDGNAVPPGVVGELWLGGAGLALGYLNLPDLTAAAFVETAQGRRYRSGDLGRWSAAGEIEILGRRDNQVKLNGIRVELGEIEQVLNSHSDIVQAVALLDVDAERRHSLWAFVRPAPGKSAPSQEGWRDFMADRLPTYMIPSAVITLPEIPLSGSGKVDRAALKKLLGARSPQGDGSAPREDGLELEVARLWSELLGIGAGVIRREDNFFALGGHSLLAIALAHRLENRLGHPVPARELFAEPTLGGFTQRISRLSTTPRPATALSDRATEGQREFWIAEHAGQDTRGFIIPLTLVPSGEIPPAARWRRAWATLVARHDALRTAFYEDAAGVLRRSIAPDLDADFEFTTMPDMPAALAHIRTRQAEPFTMAQTPLWRAGLVSIADPAGSAFWLALHHSVGDGVSVGVVTKELSLLLQGRDLPPSTGRFDESAGREEKYLSGPDCRDDASYWRRILGGMDSLQLLEEWPLDFPRPQGRTARNARGAHVFRIALPASVADGLRDLARKNGASLHALWLTILAREVHRRTGRSECLIGAAASTRDTASEAQTVGYYINMLPIPFRIHRREPIEEALREMQLHLAEGLQHARYPFALMYRDFRQDGAGMHPARHPLFDLAVTENPGTPGGAGNYGWASPANDASHYELRLNAPAQDMVLVHESQPDGSLMLQWYVDAALYEKETAEAWIDSLLGWARFLAEGKSRPGVPLPGLLPEEEHLLARWERGPDLPHPSPSLPARFEYWARVQPERDVLVAEQGPQSYAVLNARANALAHALLARGVARQEPVGVFTGRSLALPETALAIWKAGGCYLPLVEDLPADRLGFIARDAGIRILVVLDGLEIPSALAGSGCNVLRPESLSQEFLSSHRHPVQLNGAEIGGEALACILYTSGSTGEPKGVMLHHRGLINLGVGMDAVLDFSADDRTLLMASPSFDLWIADLIAAWTAGAAVAPVLRDEMNDIEGLREKIARLGITTAAMTPSYLRLFAGSDFPSVRLLTTVGEPPFPADARRYAARLRYVNGYGPTENSAATGFGEVTVQSRRLTAGKPLANTSIHILNSQGEPVPPETVGEVWLAGVGLALGYVNRPDLTAAAFIETPLGRRYRTGDLGRWTRNGELLVCGRSDGQVKLRGQRVELGEIERRLEAHPGVRQGVAIVETKADGVQTLWGFVSLDPGTPEPAQDAWRTHLSRTLPSYMIPSAVLTVPAIPVTISGKVDRGALLRLLSAQRTTSTAIDDADLLPRDSMERLVSRVWAEQLKCGRVSRDDSFFDIGGNSLLAISVVNQLKRTVHCTVNDLYEHPRMAEFARTCRPRPEHLRTLIRSAADHWRRYRNGLAAYETRREEALGPALRDYDIRNRPYQDGAVKRRKYRRVLLTGGAGYLGSYLLRELLTDDGCEVAVLIRSGDRLAARRRLGETLRYYFGPETGAGLLNNPRLDVFAGDLRRDDLGISSSDRDRLANTLQAIVHCAANVKHFGHYRDFHADNVAATARLLKLAAHRAANPADFHHVSTLSVYGRAPADGFRLFTEYDATPQVFDGNFYIRSKQEAERLVVAARGDLANACIYRVGNLAFASNGGPLQLRIRENAFFRQIAAILRLGAAPDDAHLWLCHVDSVARGVVLLAGASGLVNETHHLENARRETLAAFVARGEGMRACDFGAFLERLLAAVDEPEVGTALAETLESFRLYDGISPQERGRRLEIVSGRTQMLLARFGFVWPEAPAAANAEMLRQAVLLFTQPVDRGRSRIEAKTTESHE